MPRVGWLLLVLATAVGGAVAAVPRAPVPVVRTVVDLLPADDPFPIRRVRGTDARVPELLKELEPGPTVRLPRAEFESRVRAAGRAVAGAKHAARVVDAIYTAEFDGGDLTGTAELGVLNAPGGSGFVALDPLRLAVRGAKWADGPSAILTTQNGVPAVWVDRAGRSVLQLNWSLTGMTEPGERRFELRVPPCPVAALELILPTNQVPTAPADVLLTGPFDAPSKPGWKRWRLRFGGRARAEFAVRAGGQSGGVAQAKLVAKYELAPGQLAAQFEYDLRPARGSASEWTFLTDPALRITDVVTNNRAGWTVDPPTTPGGPRRVRVTLRQPAAGGKVLLTAVAPLADGPLPAIRPLNAVLDDEKLEVRLASGLKVEAWTAGDYRLTDATTPAAGAVDPARTLALVGTLLPPGADEAFRRMPSVRTTSAEAEFTTFERLEWDHSPARSVLAARVSVRVRRGSLFQILVRPPAGFALDRGALGADDLVSHVGTLANGQHVLEFARPLTAGQFAELRLEFRGPVAKLDELRAFPAFAVAGAAERDGWLSITTDPAWALAPKPGTGAVPGGLWGWLTTDARPDARALYLFRGKEPAGTAALVPARPTVTADATVHIDTEGGEWIATTRFAITATGGSLPALTVFVPGAPGARSWKLLDDTNAVADAVPVPRELLALAPLAPFDLLAAVAETLSRDGAGGTVWVLRFARPLTGTAVLETIAPGPATSDPATSLPVPRLVGAKQTTRAEVTAALKDRTEADLTGESVRLRTRAPGGPTPGAVSDAYLVTAVRGPGEAVAAFGGTVRDSRGGRLGVFLPAGAEVRGVCVGGRWLHPAACTERDSSEALQVPIPAGSVVRFEVRYRLAVSHGWPTRRVASTVPAVLGGTPAVKQWWAFGPGMLPGWPARPWDATDDSPPLLGGPLSGGEPFALVTRSEDTWVRTGESRTADALAGALAAGLIVLGLVAAKRRRARGAAVLALMLVLGLLVVELGPPWWARAAWLPLVAATAALAVVLVGIAARTRARAPALAAFVVLAPALAAAVQPAGPVTVLIFSTDTGEEVVAARATLERLDALTKPQPPAPVVTAAVYDLRADENGARVTAKFVVHAFRSSDNTLTLPLGDARLEGATVDGKPAFPAMPGPTTYALAVGAAGRHEVEVRFAATITANASERELRFGVPEVPEAKLTASFPSAARQPVAPGRVGRQSLTTAGDRATLDTDLGPVKTVHLRWREGAGGAATVKVREACVWDVAESGADLSAAYLVRVEQGAVAGLRWEVPAELEVLRVAARTLDAPIGPIPLRDWSLVSEKGAQRLRVDFQAPVAGRLLMLLECTPRKPITRQPVLRFPRISFGTVTGEVDSVYALRAPRGTIDGTGLGGVIDSPADPLKDFVPVADLRLDLRPDAPNPVRAFKPVPGAAAELRPAIRISEPASVRTVTTWHIGPRRADATGSVAWQSKAPISLVEFSLPVKVSEVRGPDVAAWNQSGSRVQVWLRAGSREGAVEWFATAVPAPADKPVPDGLSFDPVHPVVAQAQTAAEVRVKPVAGWSVKVDRSRGWQGAAAPPGELRFHTDQPAVPPLRVHLFSLPPTPSG